MECGLKRYQVINTIEIISILFKQKKKNIGELYTLSINMLIIIKATLNLGKYN